MTKRTDVLVNWEKLDEKKNLYELIWLSYAVIFVMAMVLFPQAVWGHLFFYCAAAKVSMLFRIYFHFDSWLVIRQITGFTLVNTAVWNYLSVDLFTKKVGYSRRAAAADVSERLGEKTASTSRWQLCWQFTVSLFAQQCPRCTLFVYTMCRNDFREDQEEEKFSTVSIQIGTSWRERGFFSLSLD